MGRSKDIATSAKGDADYVNVSGDTMTGALSINAENTKISHSTNHLILHDTSETDTGSNWWYMYRTTGDGKLRFYRGSDKLTLDGSGRMSVPNQPSAGLRMASGDQGAYNATTTNGVMKPSTIVHNIGNHYNNSTGLFTCPVAGRYLLQFSGNFYNSGAGAYHIITIMKNSSSFTWNYHNGMTNSWTHISNNIIVSCAANDALNINNGTASGSGGGSDVGKYSYISYQLIA